MPPSRSTIASMPGIAGDQRADVRLVVADDRAERRHRVERDQHGVDRGGVEAGLGERDAADRGATLHGEQAGPARPRARRAQQRQEHGVAVVGGREQLARGLTIGERAIAARRWRSRRSGAAC